MINKKMSGSFLLFLTAFIWGAAFVAQKIGIVQIGTFAFTFTRFLISGIALLPFVLINRKKNVEKRVSAEHKRSSFKKLIAGGLLCGLFLGLATNAQQIGLSGTTAGKAGFITALYIVFVPILGIFRKKKVTLSICLSVIVATGGFYMLSANEGISLDKGNAVVLLSAVLFALHILIIDHFSPQTNGIQLSCIQFFTASVISGILMLIFETPDFNAVLACWVPILYLGVVSGALAYTLQILGQKNTDPTLASLIMSTESVFAVIAGVIFLNESLTLIELAGCTLVFAAIIWSQVSSSRANRIELKCEKN